MTSARPLVARAALFSTLIAAMALSGCAGTTAPAMPGAATSASDPASTGTAHGVVAGAEEVSEPPLALLSVDAAGAVGLVDLLTGEASELGAAGTPSALASDGRYGFVTTPDGVAIVDSGRWSWNHGDHFHFYLAPPRVIGTVPGAGVATVTWGILSTAGSTGIRFADSGDAVLLDNAALSRGEIVETFRLQTPPGPGLIAPLHDGALVTHGEHLVYYGPGGEATDAAAPCAGASGAITTVAALAIGCADGALLATWEDGRVVFTHVPFPTDAAADRATAFDGRKGRPTVAALAGAAGFWLLDTRAATWQFVATRSPLVHVTAVDDADGHVVALDVEGRVRVFRDGAELAATDPLIAAVTAGVSLTLDGQRAYLNDPSAGLVHETDYADGARVARTLQTPTAPFFLAEVGR
ncbi:MAG: ABC transporter [Microbacterium sp.]|uniref:ABC transporter n=1 Tax=Microbacterium sp. TaxID=51671 RepID=UPI001AD165E9|nr:ABC transporter [Microbacterium sp.]MBN9177477.1 ABC transporter [Microbacterium sp.]